MATATAPTLTAPAPRIKWAPLLVAIAVGAIIFLIPTPHGLSRTAQIALAITGFTVVLWALQVMNNAVASVLMMALLIPAGVKPSLALSGFSSGSWWVLLAVLFYVIVVLAQPLRRAIVGTQRVLRIPPVQTHVAHTGCQQRGRRHRSRINRLVDVAEPDPVVEKCPDGFLDQPTAVPHLGDHGKLVERPTQLDEELTVFRREPERPGKLHQQSPQLLGGEQRPYALFEGRDFGILQNSRVSKPLVEFGGEEEPRIGLHLLDPKPHDMRFKELRKRAVDLDHIQVS